jgi:uncharacterized membrane protein YeaQ/YmgE (transglycosylase-associated protein family)
LSKDRDFITMPQTRRGRRLRLLPVSDLLHVAAVCAADAIHSLEKGKCHALASGIIIGLIVGLVAKLLTPGRDPGGFIVIAIIGIAGSMLATWAGQNIFHMYAPGESAGFIASVIGAIVLLVIYHLLKRGSN